MSRSTSPSANKPYGLARVCRVWRIPRATACRHQSAIDAPAPARAKRGPRSVLSDQQILDAIRTVLEQPEFLGEGYRKVWARLRHQFGVRTASRRVLRIMREHDLLAPTRAGVPRGPIDHDGTIVTERPDQMWAIDATGCLTAEGNATVFVVIDHCTGECLGAHAARRGTRFEAIECLRQAVWNTKGHYEVGIAAGTSLRHDHGSQFISNAFQDELKTVGIESSPSFVRQPQGNGCVERFIRTLKEQLLWIRPFESVEQLNLALREFAQRFNEHWILGRLGYRTPAQHRRSLLAQAA
jgi:transposase InsO family protein